MGVSKCSTTPPHAIHRLLKDLIIGIAFYKSIISIISAYVSINIFNNKFFNDHNIVVDAYLSSYF